MKKFIKSMICLAALFLILLPTPVSAASTAGDMVQYPNVSTSPDGSKRAWTTDLGDKTNERLPDGYTVDMRVASNIRSLEVGEHYYKTEAVGSITIGKWVVTHSPGQCIHDDAQKDTFAGYTYRNENCHSYYNNGWFAYCADCNEVVVHMLIYARESTVKNIKTMPASSTYVYLCPHCTHLEQGHSYQHTCIGISNNRYRVSYRSNSPEDSKVAGYMAPTMHMYDNHPVYDGKPAESIGYTDRTLRKNSYTCTGYVFMGWNTKADGSGTGYADGQEVLNLTTEDEGIVRLYAQWKKSESTLVIDAEGGTYKGESVYEQKQKYDSEYKVDSSFLMPPIGYRVSFVTSGGAAVSDIITTKSFSHWELGDDFQGQFKDNIYKYITGNGHRDTIKAQYLNNSFVLPNCNGSNASLVGWYDSPDLKDENYVGKAGETVSVNKNTVLYAKWAQLTLWAYDDYDSYGGTGAVDLKWEQKDGKSKYYRLFQSMDKSNWKEIFEADTIESSLQITETFNASKQGTTYTIPYTGNYTLTANGGKGDDYNASLAGGKGGSVTATYWLFKGDTIIVYPGLAGSGQNGGSNGSSAAGGSSTSTLGRGGGASSLVYVTRNGTKTLLLVAGGGGGANGYASGGAGGTGGGNGTISNGASGIGGGGGGKTGGIAGVAEVHNHTASCKHVHSGSPGSYGGCYTITQACGSTSFDYSEEEVGFYYGNIEYVDGEYVHVFCVRCGSDDCDGHAIIESEYCCNRCGATYGSEPSSCTAETGYGLGCGRDESYICGYNEGQIIKAASSAGGTNYIAEIYGCKNQKSQSGVNNGNGTVTLNSADIGYLEVNKLDNVAAKDTAKPDKITSYKGALSSDKLYRVTIDAPKDNGTVYYHKAESYESGTITRIAISNITDNLLVSGVKGYLYYVDEHSIGTVNVSHQFSAAGEIDVSMTANMQYLHVAVIDVAGNISDTTNITIPTIENSPDKITPGYAEKAKPATDQILLQGSEYIFEAGANRYFVKADGKTEHLLKSTGYLTQNATNLYQVDRLRLESSIDFHKEWMQTWIPKADTKAGNLQYQNQELITSGSHEELSLINTTWATATRTNEARTVSLDQHFVINGENHGKEIQVYPRAIASYEDRNYYSDEAADKSHSIILIPDGKAPVIHGIEALKNSGNINMTESEKSYTITALDEGSGIRSLTVTIINQDNQMAKSYTSDTGNLSITMSKDDYLFLGDFIVTAEAVDNVGNHTVEENDTKAFSLEAKLERSRESNDADFKAGDGAVLTITTGGYAEKVVIRFPEELLKLNPDLNKEYMYEFPEGIKTEQYEFNIPLNTPENSYVIQVEAWKNGLKLTETLELTVTTSGSITDEFRTRIRDNGV